jgi:hypothetical protein
MLCASFELGLKLTPAPGRKVAVQETNAAKKYLAR